MAELLPLTRDADVTCPRRKRNRAGFVAAVSDHRIIFFAHETHEKGKRVGPTLEVFKERRSLVLRLTEGRACLVPNIPITELSLVGRDKLVPPIVSCFSVCFVGSLISKCDGRRPSLQTDQSSFKRVRSCESTMPTGTLSLSTTTRSSIR